jgi:hypothetical protein
MRSWREVDEKEKGIEDRMKSESWKTILEERAVKEIEEREGEAGR